MNGSTSRVTERVRDDDGAPADAHTRKDRALRSQPHVVLDDHRSGLGQQLALVEVVEGGVVDRDVGRDLDAIAELDAGERGERVS